MRGSRIFFREGGPDPTARKQSGQRFFFSTYFTVYRALYYRKSYTFLRIQRKSNINQGGSNLFQGGGGGGVKMLISMETHITCDFQGGSGPPTSPLGPHMGGAGGNPLVSSQTLYH